MFRSTEGAGDRTIVGDGIQGIGSASGQGARKSDEILAEWAGGVGGVVMSATGGLGAVTSCGSAADAEAGALGGRPSCCGPGDAVCGKPCGAASCCVAGDEADGELSGEASSGGAVGVERVGRSSSGAEGREMSNGGVERGGMACSGAGGTGGGQTFEGSRMIGSSAGGAVEADAEDGCTGSLGRHDTAGTTGRGPNTIISLASVPATRANTYWIDVQRSAWWRPD